MESSKMSLKLLIDTNANKVLFAEAGKDFVDLLFNLLSLPVGTVIKLLKGRSMVGCIGNVYRSVGNLKEDYLQHSFSKDILLNPKPSTSSASMPVLLTGRESSNICTKLFTCQSDHGYVSNEYGDKCPNCYGTNAMRRELKHVQQSVDISSNPNTKSVKGYVQGIVTYMISDDLSVTPMSMISSISLLTRYNISQLDALEERVVEFGTLEALELLKASFQSEAALTTVFLGKKGSSSCRASKGRSN